jgi:hypothetical protein
MSTGTDSNGGTVSTGDVNSGKNQKPTECMAIRAPCREPINNWLSPKPPPRNQIHHFAFGFASAYPGSLVSFVIYHRALYKSSKHGHLWYCGSHGYEWRRPLASPCLENLIAPEIKTNKQTNKHRLTTSVGSRAFKRSE